MKQIVFDVPGMYGDHHTMKVRELLLGTTGVTDVTASAARRKVAVAFDEAQLSAEKIQEALAAAGYSEDPSVLDGLPKRHKDGSAWNTLGDRSTVTERKDREMAGDHRRY
jgi:copper chaperone CopZ